MKRRNQPESSSGSALRPGNGSSGKRGAPPAESSATSARPWYRAADRSLWVEQRDEVHEARERRQPAEPAAPTSRDAEVEADAEGVGAGGVFVPERDRRLGDDEREIALQAVEQSLSLVAERVSRRRQVDEDVVTADFDRESAQVVRPLVERAARADVVASVVPVTRENPVGERAALEREAHVRAAVVDSVHAIVVREEADDVTVEVDDEAAGSPELCERCGSGERALADGHDRTLEPQVWLKSSAGRRAHHRRGRRSERSPRVRAALLRGEGPHHLDDERRATSAATSAPFSDGSPLSAPGERRASRSRRSGRVSQHSRTTARRRSATGEDSRMRGVPISSTASRRSRRSTAGSRRASAAAACPSTPARSSTRRTRPRSSAPAPTTCGHRRRR